MLRTPFNDGWRWRPKANSFLEQALAPAAWQAVTLPHDAVVGAARSPEHAPGAPTGFYPGGVFEYVRSFTPSQEQREGRLELDFDGVYRQAVVYVNGDLAGHRPSGYVPFRVRIDPLLRDGENEIRVECRTHLDSRWYAGAGIYREVSLLQGGPVHLASDGLGITTPDVDDERAVVDVVAAVQNDSGRLAPAAVAFDVVDADGTVVATAEVAVTARPNAGTVVRQRLTVPAPVRWSLGSPTLYTCRARLLTDGAQVDVAEASFGIRTLQWDAMHGLRINGEAVTLRGGCLHHDNGVLGAATFPRAEERRIELLKDAGYNAVRSAHNPISTAMLDACDRVGMLVMDEAFDVWTSPKSDFDHSVDLPAWWRADLESMVLRDRNHPSVVMYSIGNEIPEVGSPWGAALGRDMVELVKSLDPTRPVTNGINPFFAFTADVRAAKSAEPGSAMEVGINTLMSQLADAGAAAVASDRVTERIEEAAAQLDVVGYNYAEARYESDLERHPQRIIVGTESDAARIETVWDLVTRHPRVLGDFSWTAWDYLGEAGIGRVSSDEEDKGFLGRFPWRTAWAGDLDICGRRRSVSFYRETVWGLRTAPHIAVHPPGSAGKAVTPWGWDDSIDSWSWPGREGDPVVVDVYTDADVVELVLNDVSVGRAEVGAHRRFVARFETRYAPGELVAVALRGGHELGRAALRSAGESVHLQARADRSRLAAYGQDLAFVDIRLVDQLGLVHVARDRRVQVTVSGAGVLQGLGSADPRSLDDYTGSACGTFAGRALAVVRATGPGEITVRVEAGECETTVVLAAVNGAG